jgi:hypothetical protein
MRCRAGVPVARDSKKETGVPVLQSSAEEALHRARDTNAQKKKGPLE